MNRVFIASLKREFQSEIDRKIEKKSHKLEFEFKFGNRELVRETNKVKSWCRR